MQMVEEKAVSPLVTVEKVAYIKSWYHLRPFINSIYSLILSLVCYWLVSE